jgi:soluble lytic murein transglycosylase-like protein
MSTQDHRGAKGQPWGGGGLRGLLAFAVGLCLLTQPCFGQATQGHVMTPQERNEQIREITERRRARAKARGSTVKGGFFVRKDGRIVCTDNPSKYRYRPEYDEIKVNLRPIQVMPQYRGYRGRYRPEDYTKSEIYKIVDDYARLYNLDPQLVLAMIKVESDFEPYAVSPKGACGLMQLMPGTAAEMKVNNIYDATENIAGGTQYFSKLLNLFNGNIAFALAAYNAGPGTVKKYSGIPPYKETQNYVRAVLKEAGMNGGPGVDPKLLAKADKKIAIKAATEKGEQQMVHFHSGKVYEVDKVVEDERYYFIEMHGRTFCIAKRLVKKIEQPA